MSLTHTTSAAPAPALSPATVALSSTANSIITLLHSSPASPELLFYLNAKDLPALRTVAPSVSTFLKGRKEALDGYLAENEAKEVRVSEKTKAFWLENKSATEDLLTALDEADKSESELSESGRKAREEYFEKTKAAWEVGLADVLNKLSKDLAVPFALGTPRHVFISSYFSYRAQGNRFQSWIYISQRGCTSWSSYRGVVFKTAEQ